MLELRPFAAVRYNPDIVGRDQSNVLAPPYDVLESSDKSALLSRSPYNVVAIDLPHVPPKSAGPAEAYEAAAAMMRQWLTDGVLIRERMPAIYLYHQRFDHAGETYTRRMFLAGLRLAPISEGVILPHEQTFGGPKEDRLALMKATGCQLSPILGLYSDPGEEVSKAFAAIARREPDVIGTLHGVENRMWVVADEAVIARVAAVMMEKKVYIADGHHRYGTALLYRDWIAQQDAPRGVPGLPTWSLDSLPPDHPAQFVMFALCNMDDPGCLILPYYRAVESINLDALLDAWREGVELAGTDVTGEAPPRSPPLGKGGIKGGVSAAGPADLVVHEGTTGFEVALRYTNRAILKSLEAEESPAWHALDYAYLHRYLIDELLAKYLSSRSRPGGDGMPWQTRVEQPTQPKLHYLKSAEDAIRVACQTDGVALLTNATPMAHLRAVSEAGGLMPQKSTYFHPKLATGITINPVTYSL